MSGGVSIGAVQRLNSFDVTGSFAGGRCRLDDLVIEHLQLVRVLESFSAVEELVLRMLVEGYSQGDIAIEAGISLRTVARLVGRLRLQMLELDPRKAN